MWNFAGQAIVFAVYFERSIEAMSVLNQSGEEQVECPLCMEPLEVDDLTFYPCTCGYQVSENTLLINGYRSYIDIYWFIIKKSINSNNMQ